MSEPAAAAGTAADPAGPGGPGGPADHRYTVRGRVERFAGAMFTVVTDRVAMPGGGEAERDYLRHVGAVALVPLDADGRVVLVCQYRHPVGRALWELPAGLVDVAGEALPAVARRELAEEADLVCGRLDLLIDLHPSPGCSDERIRIFLARDLAAAPGRHARQHEESTMVVARFTLEEALRMVFTGRVTNAAAAAGLLAAAHARDRGWAPLRPADRPLTVE